MITFIGLTSCDTCRKARRHLDNAGMAYRTVDVRADGVPEPLLRDLMDQLGPSVLINRRSTTWRALDDADKDRLAGDQAATEALALLARYPTLMKRPILCTDADPPLVGYRAADYQAAIEHTAS